MIGSTNATNNNAELKQLIAGTLTSYRDSLGEIVRIKDSCFKGCSDLQAVEFPAVRYIGDNAFNGCSNLTSIKLAVNQVPTIYGDPFLNSGIENEGKIYITESLVDSFKTYLSENSLSSYVNNVEAIIEE